MNGAQRRFRMRWSLRTALLVMLSICVALSVLSTKVKRQLLVNSFVDRGWTVHYDDEVDAFGRYVKKSDPVTKGAPLVTPNRPKLLRNVLVDAFFG